MQYINILDRSVKTFFTSKTPPFVLRRYAPFVSSSQNPKELWNPALIL